MKLKRLEIQQIESWERENPGKYKCTVKYECDDGDVTLVLDPELSTNLLGYLGPVITEYSRRTSVTLEKQIAQAIQEAKRLPEIALNSTVE